MRYGFKKRKTIDMRKFRTGFKKICDESGGLMVHTKEYNGKVIKSQFKNKKYNFTVLDGMKPTDNPINGLEAILFVIGKRGSMSYMYLFKDGKITFRGGYMG